MNKTLNTLRNRLKTLHIKSKPEKRLFKERLKKNATMQDAREFKKEITTEIRNAKAPYFKENSQCKVCSNLLERNCGSDYSFRKAERPLKMEGGSLAVNARGKANLRK